MWDFNSDAAQSTDFAITRFFVPLLAHSGWCLFADCDIVFLADPRGMLDYADETKALMVVKHAEISTRDVKMDGRVQSSYKRKWWSSIVLWNASSAANRRLNLTTLNQWPGRDLHKFAWLADEEIGELPREWNWLVGVQDRPENAKVAHFTLGIPGMPNAVPTEHDDIWTKEALRT